jgi:pimeloyl-ACP methyl ester carboxylesterase
MLAPYLGYDAPSTRRDSGGWASVDIPRILGLLVLRKLGITCCEALPVLALAVPPNSEKALVATYTDRLMRKFGTGDFRRDLATATKPLTIICGYDDELMLADKYVEAVRGAAVPVDVRLLDGINHMGIVAAPKAVSLIADDVATRAMAGS